MSPVVATEPVTTALITTLASGTAAPVGDHDAPRPTNAVPDPTRGRYLVVWQVPGGGVEGTWGNPHDMATFVYQVDSHGRSRQQCQWLSDRVRQVMLDRTASGWLHPITVTGWVIAYRNQQTLDTPENAGRDETGQDLFVCRERYELMVVPA